MVNTLPYGGEQRPLPSPPLPQGGGGYVMGTTVGGWQPALLPSQSPSQPVYNSTTLSAFRTPRFGLLEEIYGSGAAAAGGKTNTVYLSGST